MYQIWYILRVSQDNIKYQLYGRSTSLKEVEKFFEPTKIHPYRQVIMIWDTRHGSTYSIKYQSFETLQKAHNRIKQQEIFDRFNLYGVPLSVRHTKKCIKDHVCRMCLKKIKKGSSYTTYTTKSGYNSYGSAKICVKCEKRLMQ